MTIWENAGRITERMFHCRADIWIYEEKTTTWGESRQEKRLLYEEMPCRVARERASVSSGGLLLNEEKTATLLFPIVYSVPKGSSVAVKKEDGTKAIYHTVGAERLYRTHKETSLRGAERT